MTLGKERERIHEEMLIFEKRAKLEEEALKKRVKLHEDYGKEQELKN
jgi:hypothetical protein